MTRPCTTCKERKPDSEFWHRGDGKPLGECKLCMNARSKAWKSANRERVRKNERRSLGGARRQRPIAAILAAIKGRAKKAGIEFSLTEADIVIPERCPILGIKLRFGIGNGYGASLAERDRAPSIDRVDNAKGYVPGNIVIVSYRANRIKSDATIEELSKIAEWYKRHVSDGSALEARDKAPAPRVGELSDDLPEMLSYEKKAA